MESLVGKVVRRWPSVTLYMVEAQWEGAARLAVLTDLANGERRIYPSHQLTVVQNVDAFKRRHKIPEPHQAVAT